MLYAATLGTCSDQRLIAVDTYILVLVIDVDSLDTTHLDYIDIKVKSPCSNIPPCRLADHGGSPNDNCFLR